VVRGEGKISGSVPGKSRRGVQSVGLGEQYGLLFRAGGAERNCEMDYSIDETKLMMKLKRYKRRWKEQRHYSEYLKCKLAKKAMQVHELKSQLAEWENNGWEADKDAEIARLNGWLDELMNVGSKASYSLFLQNGDNRYSEAWKALVARIQKERNHD